MIRSLLVWLMICLLPAGGFAQRRLYNAPAGKLKRFGDRAYQKGDVEMASLYYHFYLKKRPRDADRAYRLAGIYRMQGNYRQAGQYYFLVLNKGASPYEYVNDTDKIETRTYYRKYPLTRLYFAQMLKSAGHPDSAIKQFRGFIQEYSGSQQEFYHAFAQAEIEGCNWMRAKQVPDKEVYITAMPDDADHSSFFFGPVMDARNSILAHAFSIGSAAPGRPLLDLDLLRWSPRRKESRTIKVRGGPLNAASKLSIAGSISADGNQIYCLQCDRKVNYTAEPWSLQGTYLDNCALYSGHYKSGQASQLTRLNAEINRPGCRNIMPAICKDSTGRGILYFVSDRAGGYGGLDIWYSVYSQDKKEFLPAINAGREVNTFLDEISPFYSPDSGYLYFSTNGRAGKGAFDIFRIKGEPGKWQSPLNMSQFNSFMNDWSFVTDRTEQFGYFTKEVFCKCTCFGIYQSKIPGDAEHLAILFGQTVGIEALGKEDHCFNIMRFQYPVKGFAIRTYAVSANDPKRGFLEDVKVRMYRTQPNTGNMENQVDSFVLRNKKKYFHTIQPHWYILRLEKEGFETKDTLLQLDTLTLSDTLEFPVEMQPSHPPKTIVLSNVFFDFDDARLSRDSKRALDTTLLKFLELNPTKKVLILSHTDNKGNDEYNLKLSQQRAENIMDYLRKRGIDPRRMEARGYGSAHPVAPNNHPDGSDNPEGRALNRRTEFKVVGNMKVNE